MTVHSFTSLEPASWRVFALLAVRNLRRHVSRTILTATAMILGGAMLILAFSLSDGGQEKWILEAARMGTGHVTIEHPEFRTAARIENRLSPETTQIVASALLSAEVAPFLVASASRLSISGLASSAVGGRPVRIAAVDPDAEALLSNIDTKVVAGRYLQKDDTGLAYIGVRLAANLDLDLGSRLVVQAEDESGEVASQLLRVVGIFRSGVTEIDQATLQIPLKSAETWLGTSGGVTSFKLVLTHSSAVPRVVASLEKSLANPVGRGQVAVLDWKEANPSLASAIALDDFSGWIVQILLFTIIAFGIMNAILMSVLHRHREFGILRAIGLTPRQTGLLVVVEGLILTLASGLIGVGLGTFLVWYFLGDGLDLTGSMGDMTISGVVFEPIIVPEFRFERFIHSFGFIFVIGIIASFYPALRAAKIDIVEVLKFDR